MMLSGGRLMAISTSIGSLRMDAASLRILGGIVAENITVWHELGSCLYICMMSSKKPMSSMRSASSKTK